MMIKKFRRPLGNCNEMGKNHFANGSLNFDDGRIYPNPCCSYSFILFQLFLDGTRPEGSTALFAQYTPGEL